MRQEIPVPGSETHRYVFYERDEQTLWRVEEPLATRVDGPHTGMGFTDVLNGGQWRPAIRGFDPNGPFIEPVSAERAAEVAKKIAGKRVELDGQRVGWDS